MKFLETAFQKLLGGSSEFILSLANPRWDAMIFVFLFITTLFYGLGLSRNKILTFLFSTYIALAVVDSMPFISSWWGGFRINPELSLGLTFLAIIIFMAAFVFAHAALKKYFTREEIKGSIIYNFLLSLLHVGLVINVVLSSFPPEVAAAFSPFTQRLFMGDIARFFWFMLPLITIILLRKSTPIEEEDLQLE